MNITRGSIRPKRTRLRAGLLGGHSLLVDGHRWPLSQVGVSIRHVERSRSGAVVLLVVLLTAVACALLGPLGLLLLLALVGAGKRVCATVELRLPTGDWLLADVQDEREFEALRRHAR